MAIKGIEEITPKLKTDSFPYRNTLDDRNIFVHAAARPNISQHARSLAKTPGRRVPKGTNVQVSVSSPCIEIATTRISANRRTGKNDGTKDGAQKDPNH